MPDLSIPVRHVIFTRVERAYSPRNTSGYQIAYQSPSLGQEVTQIEKRLQCFETGKSASERHQFFWTDRDQAVLAKTVPLLRPDPEVIDSSRRDAFLAHALVIRRNAFAAVRNDPFAVFEAAELANLLAKDEEQLTAYLRSEPPPETLTIRLRKSKDVSFTLDNWPSDELARLFHLALQASTMSRQSQSLMLLPEDQYTLYNLLFLLFLLIPQDVREFCTFDTFVDGCYPSAGSLWAMGSSRDHPHPNLLPIYVQERRLVFKGGGDGDFPNPKTLMRTAPLSADLPGCTRGNSVMLCAWTAWISLIEYGMYAIYTSICRKISGGGN